MKCYAKIGGLVARWTNLPWYASVLVGEVVFAWLRWIVPALLSSCPMFKPVVAWLPDLAWAALVLSLAFGLNVLQTQKRLHPAHWRRLLGDVREFLPLMKT